MAKYMILYSSTMPAAELMAQTTPEQMKVSMDEWIQWNDEANKTAKVEFGLPLQAVAQLTPGEVDESKSHISGYATMEGESKAMIVELLKSHPHLKRQGASIDVLEMLPMPGLETN